MAGVGPADLHDQCVELLNASIDALDGRGPKQRVFDLPGGHPRLTTPGVGVHGVWVNGVRELERLPGKFLRDFDG